MGTKKDTSRQSKTDFGYYEKRLCLLIMISTITNSLSTFQVVITQYTPQFHCDIESVYKVLANSSNADEILNQTIPFIRNDDNELVRSSCTYYNNTVNGTLSSNDSDKQVVECSTYKYYGPAVTATTQFNMVCGRAYLQPVMTSLFMVGKLVGGLVGGALSDRYGRRPCFLIFTFYQHVLTAAQSFTNDPISYGVFMFLNGFGGLVNFMAMAIIGTEFLPPRFRHSVLFLGTVGYSFGYMLVPVLGYYINDWRWYLRVTGLAGVMYIPYYWLIDETPYWLISRKKEKEAKQLLEKIAKMNGVKLENDEGIFSNPLLSESNTEEMSIARSWVAIFKSWKLFYRLLIIGFSWCMTSALYYSISFGTNHLSGDRFWNLFYASLMEFVSAFVYFLATSKFEQRNVFIGFMSLTGVCVAFSPILRSLSVGASIAIFMVGKLASAVVFSVVYTYTGEIFPTAIRHSALAAAAMCSRLGGILAPYLIYAGQNGGEATSTLSVGIMGIISAALYLKLPDTKNLPLPKTIQEAVQMNKGVLCQCGFGNDQVDGNTLENERKLAEEECKM